MPNRSSFMRLGTESITCSFTAWTGTGGCIVVAATEIGRQEVFCDDRVPALAFSGWVAGHKVGRKSLPKTSPCGN